MDDPIQEITSAPTAVPLLWRTETTTDPDTIVVEESYGEGCGMEDRRIISRSLREVLPKKRLCWYPTWGRRPSSGLLLGTTAPSRRVTAVGACEFEELSVGWKYTHGDANIESGELKEFSAFVATTPLRT